MATATTSLFNTYPAPVYQICLALSSSTCRQWKSSWMIAVLTHWRRSSAQRRSIATTGHDRTATVWSLCLYSVHIFSAENGYRGVQEHDLDDRSSKFKSNKVLAFRCPLIWIPHVSIILTREPHFGGWVGFGLVIFYYFLIHSACRHLQNFIIVLSVYAFGSFFSRKAQWFLSSLG